VTAKSTPAPKPSRSAVREGRRPGGTSKTSASAKSDPGDSYKLADYLRTDGHRLPWLRPLDAPTRQLQVLSRLRDDHVEAKTAASNQLGALLDAHWPGAKAIFSHPVDYLSEEDR
jgi:hypothetical protein